MSVLTTSDTGNGRDAASSSDFATVRFHNLISTALQALNSLYSERFDVRHYVLTCLLAIAGTTTLTAEEWRTGAEFFGALDSNISITVENSPIGDSLRRLSQAQAVALFVDRRVDPGSELTISVDQQPLADVLRKVARDKRLGVGFVGPVIYVGPPVTAARVATLGELKNDEAHALSSELGNKMLAKQPLVWPRLSEPRWIIRKLCAEASLKIITVEAIPHDLWTAGDYPEMTLAERLTLVLAGFGMTYAVDEKRNHLILKWMPEAVAVERVYPTRMEASRIIPALRKDYPQAFILGEGNQIRVRSTIEDHWAIEAYLSPGKRPRRSTSGEQIYSLTVKDKPLGPVVEQIASRLDLEVEFGTGASRLKDVLVSFAVTNVALEELFQAAVGPAKLSATIDGKTVRIE